MLSNLKSRVETAKKAHCKWQQWVPVKDKAEFHSRVKELEHQTAQLVTRKAEFIVLRRQEDAQLGSINVA